MISGSSALARLEADGLLRRVGDRHRTTRRWQGAMARAALHLMEVEVGSAQLEDLRVPIAHALIELYGDELADHELGELVAAITPIEIAELGPLTAAVSITAQARV